MAVNSTRTEAVVTMSKSMAQPLSALEHLNDATPCGHSVKADLRPHTPACDMRGLAKEALKRTAKQEVAADTLGISQPRLSHKFADGTLNLKEMSALGPEYLAALGQQLVEQYGALQTPKARARQGIRDMRALLDELDQFVEVA